MTDIVRLYVDFNHRIRHPDEVYWADTQDLPVGAAIVATDHDEIELPAIVLDAWHVKVEK